METIEFLAQVAAQIQADGKFISAKDGAANGVLATGTAAKEAIQDGEISYSDADFALAQDALVWLRGYEGDTKFLLNVKKTIELDTIAFRNADLAAFTVKCYQEKDHGPADMSAYKDATFCGTVGSEVAFKGEIVGLFTLKGGRFGDQNYVTMVDANRPHVFLWKTSTAVANLKVGAKIRCEGTVKEHKAYKGVNQTRIVRPKIRTLA